MESYYSSIWTTNLLHYCVENFPKIIYFKHAYRQIIALKKSFLSQITKWVAGYWLNVKHLSHFEYVSNENDELSNDTSTSSGDGDELVVSF